MTEKIRIIAAFVVGLALGTSAVTAAFLLYVQDTWQEETYKMWSQINHTGNNWSELEGRLDQIDWDNYRLKMLLGNQGILIPSKNTN